MGKPSRKRKNPHGLHGQWPEPHTPAWFARMLRFHPTTVFFAQAHIARSGRLDGCSVCGDTPAPMCDAVDAPHHSLRLCDDCREIRAAMYDEHYELRSGRA